MPYVTEWVDPEIFLTKDGINIYHTYKNDEIEVGPSTYWYTTDTFGTQNSGHEEGCEFDVRTLPMWSEEHHPMWADGYDVLLDYIKNVIILALEQNLIPIATTNRMSNSN